MTVETGQVADIDHIGGRVWFRGPVYRNSAGAKVR